MLTRRIFAGFIALTTLTLVGCKPSSSPSSAPATSPDPTDVQDDREIPDGASDLKPDVFLRKMQPIVQKFCSDCHVMPRPSSSPKHEWPAEVDQGFMLYVTSGRNDLRVPDRDDVLKYFQLQAPEELDILGPTLGHPPTDLKLSREEIRFDEEWTPAVTNLRWLDIGIGDQPAMVYCDISTGAVKAHWLGGTRAGTTERLATLLQPVHVEAGDLDADGHLDLIVSDIGEFNADDSDLGRVVWLRRQANSEKFTSIVLADGLSRVSDARPGDFDGDGDLDVLVAVFGWRNSGRIVMLENMGTDDSGQLPTFELRAIDERHGPVHVPPIDLNGDGHLDFVALISQDHECVEAFINRGDGSLQFDRQVIYRAPDPAYGSSGIELVDMDGDGDLDVLYSNGDSFDRGLKPYHSIQWLENTGGYPYQHHHIGKMPGVLSARAGDFDGDGDMDVVAGSLWANPLIQQAQNLDTTSIVMLTQTAPGVFHPSKVEGGIHYHLSIETGDFDGDGKQEFAAGNFIRNLKVDAPEVVVWWNRE
ncbi:FG-GAP repeat domain-containing protein [Rubripirellula lacrimiformis]